MKQSVSIGDSDTSTPITGEKDSTKTAKLRSALDAADDHHATDVVGVSLTLHVGHQIVDRIAMRIQTPRAAGINPLLADRLHILAQEGAPCVALHSKS